MEILDCDWSVGMHHISFGLAVSLVPHVTLGKAGLWTAAMSSSYGSHWSTIALVHLLAVASLTLPAESQTAKRLRTVRDGAMLYTLHFSRVQLTWSAANELCEEEGGRVALAPDSNRVINTISDYNLVGSIWLSGDTADECLSFKRECRQLVQSAFGSRCEETALAPVTVDCLSKKRYVLCVAESEDLAPASTSWATITTITAATTTSQLTTSQNSFVTTPMTTTGQKVPNGVSSKMTPGNTQHPSLSTLPPPAGIEPAQSSHTGSKFVDRLTVFMLGLSAAKKDLLGLIIGVVTGTFLIIALVLVICCACHGSGGSRRLQHQRYEYMKRNSQHSLIKSGHSGSDHSSNTLDTPYRSEITEESSLALSDINSSHSSRPLHLPAQRDYCYPPPPSLYDVPDNEREHFPQKPVLGSPTFSPNFIYATVNKNHRETLQDDFPLPPPPPPHRQNVVHFEDIKSNNVTKVQGLKPSFMTFLDKTIAVKPMPNHHLNRARNYPHLAVDDSADDKLDKSGLLTSDL